MQLDPGFTWEGFWANAGVQFVSAFFGMLGALVVALIVYTKTRNDQWAIFEEEAKRAARIRKEEEEEQRLRIRAALHHEVADNLRRLEAFWPRIVSPGDEKQGAAKAATRLVDTTVPSRTTGVLQGAAALVAVALTREQLDETYRLYTTLAEILETQRRLQVARDSDTAAFGAAPDTFAGVGAFGPTKIAMTNYFGDAANNL